MIKNRYFKNTLGLFAEVIIATALDTEETSPVAAVNATVAIPVTIAADPTPGDLITITVNGVAYTYTVPVADATTQQAHDGIASMLALNAQGFELVNSTGTTSSVFNLAWAGADKNTLAVALAETGATFTVAGPYAFAGGVDADAAASDDLDAFVANSNAGTIWAFWEDTKIALVPGDTSLYANRNRKFFYAWKDSAGNTKTSTAIPVAGLKYENVAYAAGQVQITNITYGGTISATQIVHLKISETTATNLPYPSWSYEAVVGSGGINAAVTALKALVNAETEDPIVTAEDTTDTLELTGVYKNRTFKVSTFIEVSPTQTTDASAITFPTGGTTQAAEYPIGDLATVREIEQYAKIYAGAINYAPEGTNVDEWQTWNTNLAAVTQWGILMVYADREEAGVVYNHKATPKAYVMVVVPTGSQDDLAAL